MVMSLAYNPSVTGGLLGVITIKIMDSGCQSRQKFIVYFVVNENVIRSDTRLTSVGELTPSNPPCRCL